MTFVKLPHSQSRITATSATACLACYGYTTRIDKLSLRQYRACVVDSFGLGVLYHCTVCTRHPDLVFLDFYAIPHVHVCREMHVYTGSLYRRFACKH